MGKQEYDFNLSVGISEILDKDSAKEVERQITRQKAKIEEPVEIKLSADDALDEYQKLEKKLKDLTKKYNSATEKQDWASVSSIARDLSLVQTRMESLTRELQEQGDELQKNVKLTKNIRNSVDEVGDISKKTKRMSDEISAALNSIRSNVNYQLKRLQGIKIDVTTDIDTDELREVYNDLEDIQNKSIKLKEKLNNLQDENPQFARNFKRQYDRLNVIFSDLDKKMSSIKPKLQIDNINTEVESTTSKMQEQTEELKEQTKELKEQTKELEKQEKVKKNNSDGFSKDYQSAIKKFRGSVRDSKKHDLFIGDHVYSGQQGMDRFISSSLSDIVDLKLTTDEITSFISELIKNLKSIYKLNEKDFDFDGLRKLIVESLDIKKMRKQFLDEYQNIISPIKDQDGLKGKISDITNGILDDLDKGIIDAKKAISRLQEFVNQNLEKNTKKTQKVTTNDEDEFIDSMTDAEEARNKEIQSIREQARALSKLTDYAQQIILSSNKFKNLLKNYNIPQEAQGELEDMFIEMMTATVNSMNRVPGSDKIQNALFDIIKNFIIQNGSIKLFNQDNPLLLAQKWFRENGKLYVDDQTVKTLGDEWEGIHKRNQKYITRSPSSTAMGGDSYYENMWGMDEDTPTGLRPILLGEDGERIITKIDQTIKILELMDKTLRKENSKKNLESTYFNLTDIRNGEEIFQELFGAYQEAGNLLQEYANHLKNLAANKKKQAEIEMETLREGEKKDNSTEKSQPRIIHQATKMSDGSDFAAESFMPVELSRMIQILRDAIKHDPKSYFDFSKVNNTNDLNKILSGGAFQIYSDDVQWTIQSVQLDSSKTSANITSFNRELGLVLEQQYKLLQNSDDTLDENEEQVTIESESFDLVDAKLKFLPEQAKKYAEEIQGISQKNEKWLNDKIYKLNNLESKYTNSNERIDQDISLSHPEATTLTGDNLKIQDLYDHLRSVFKQISDGTLKLTEQVKLDIDKDLKAYSTEGTNAYRISHTNTTFSQTAVDTAIRQYNSVFNTLMTSAKKNKIYDVLKPEFEKLRSVLPEIGSDFSNVTKDTIADIISMTRELRSSLASAMGEERFQEANQKLTDNMKTANTEIETLSLKLKGISKTAPGINEAAKAIDQMRSAQQKFESSTEFEDRDTYESEYKNAKKIAQANLELARTGQQYENKFNIPEINKYKEIYDVLIKVIPKINEYNSAILKAQQQDKGTGTHKTLIESLQRSVGIEIDNLKNILNDPLITGSQEEKMAFDLPNIFKNIDGSDSILRFLTEAQKASKLTSDEISNLGDQFRNALKIDAESADRFYQMFDKKDKLVQEFYSLENFNQESILFKKLNKKGQDIELLRSQYGKNPTEWTPEQENNIRQEISSFEKLAEVVKKLYEYEQQRFSGKSIYQKGMQTDFLDESVEKMKVGMSETKLKLEDNARSFIKEKFGEDAQAIIKKFTTDVHGISTLDFSFLDQATGKIRNFRMELGKLSQNPSLEEILGKTKESLQNRAGNQLDKINSLLGIEDISKDSTQYNNAVKARNNLAESLGSGVAVDDATLIKLIKDAQLAESALNKLYKKHVEYLNLIDNGSAENINTIDPNINQVQQANNALDLYAKNLGMNVENVGKFNQTNETMKATLKDGSKQIYEVTIAFDRLSNQIIGIQSGVRQGTSSWEKFISSFKIGSKQIISALIGYNVFYKIIGEIRKGFNYVKEIDMAMTELKKVTDETEYSYKNFLNTAAQTGAEIGSTISDFTNATADFARLGYNLDESTEMAKAALVYKNVADGISSVDEATKSIISTIKAFDLSAENSMQIADKFNEVGNNFAITSAGIGIALQKSASALFSAGNTIDESIALITAANSVVQNPEIVGTALKTLSLRIRGAKVELQDAGLEVDNMATSVSKLQSKILALTHGKVNIMQDADTFKNTTQILREMASVWEEMTDIEQASALELLGGKRQANILSSILTNFDTVEQVISTSMGAEGSAMAENEKYLDSIKGKTDILKNSMQEMWNNAIQSETVKNFMDLLNILVKLIDKAGVFKVILSGLVVRQTFKSGFNIFDFDWKGATAGAETFGTKIVAIGKSMKFAEHAGELFTSVLSGLFSMGISMAIGILVDELNKAAHAAENLKKEVSDLVTDYQNDYTELKDSLDRLTTSSDPKQYENLVSEFEVLANGVDKYGNNLNLTADQYQRYADICEMMIDIDPALVDGYDSATEAIKNNSEELQNLIDRKKEEARLNSKGFVEDENLTKILENTKNDIKEAEYTLYKLTDLHSTSDSSIFNLLSDEYEHIGNEFAGTTTQDRKLLMESVLYTLGFTNDESEIDNIISKYIFDEGFGKTLQDFFMDYGDLIAENYNKFEESDLKDWASNWTNTQKKLKKLSVGMISTLLEVPRSMEEYDDLSKNSKSFITEWIKNNSDFEIDSSTTIDDILVYKSQIEDFVSGINDLTAYSTEIDGKKISAQNILDSIFDLNTSNIDWGPYKEEMQKLIEHLWDAIGGENNTLGFKDENSLAVRLGIDFKLDKEEAIIKQYQRITGESEEQAKEFFNSTPAMKVNRYFEINWNELDSDNYKEALYGDIKFDILDYSDSIELLYENIKKYQDALSLLDSGEFNLSNFTALIKEFPELAEGVDTSSESFNGLQENLKKAIKESPEPLIEDLEELSDQLDEVGKSTDGVDNLVSSIKNIPTDAVESLSDTYKELTDNIIDANNAQKELSDSMKREKTNYEIRVEALNEIKDLVSKGLVGSESNVWDLSKQFGVGYDFSNHENSINELVEKIKTLDELDVYGLTSEGDLDPTKLENFVKYVDEKLKNVKLDFEYIWDYGDDGFKFDLDAENWETFANAIGFTKDELTDFISAISLYAPVDFGDSLGVWEDKIKEFEKIVNSTDRMEIKLSNFQKKMTEIFDTKVDLANRPFVSAEEMIAAGRPLLDDNGVEVESGSYATLYSESHTVDGKKIIVTPILPDGTVLSDDALNEYIDDYIETGIDTNKIVLGVFDVNDEKAYKYEEFLHQVQDIYSDLSDPEGIKRAFAESNYIFDDFIKSILQDKNVLFTQFDDNLFIDEESFKKKFEEYGDIVQKFLDKNEHISLKITEEDPLGLKNIYGRDLTNYLSSLNISNQNIDNRLTLDVEDFISVMKEKGWDQAKISEYMKSLNNKFNFSIDGNIINSENITEELNNLLNLGTSENTQDNNVITNYEVVGSGVDTLKEIKEWTADVTSNPIIEQTYKLTKIVETIYGDSGIASHLGGSFANGSPGVGKSETALVGELGPEMVVRGRNWFTVGDNGAEFFGVKRGDIIFNHKQTKELLEKGSSTSRGKAFVSGTAYARTNHSSKFSDQGIYLGYSKNTGGYGQAVEDAAKEFLEIFDWIEVRLEEINNQLSLQEAILGNQVGYNNQNQIIDNMIQTNNILKDNFVAGIEEYKRYSDELLLKVPEEYRDAAKNGKISIESFEGKVGEETLTAIKDYREWMLKGEELKIELEQTKTEIAELAKQKFDNVVNQFENIQSVIEDSNGYIEDQISLMENSGRIASAEYYKEMMKNTDARKASLEEEKSILEKTLQKEVEAGNIEVGSDAWYDMNQQIRDVNSSILECVNSQENYQNAINDIYWNNFDELINRYDQAESEIGNLIDLMGEYNAVSTPDTESGWGADDVSWTDEGISALALYGQQMEIAERKSQEYNKAINDLTNDYNAGKYSESEYLEKLNELKSAQYDTVKSYNDSRKAIKQLNEERINSIKNGIDKEIESYDKLIETKKKNLDSEKDLRDFEKDISNKQKNIAELERQISVLALDDSIESIAKRKRLEAELMEQRQELDETYYNRSVEDQKNALDKENEDFENQKEQEKLKWEKYLEDIDQVVSDSFEIIKTNATTVYDTLNEKSQNFGIILSDSILTPWQEGYRAISDYDNSFNNSASNTQDQLNLLKVSWQEIIDEMDKYAKIDLNKTISMSTSETNAYAKGTNFVSRNQIATVDENGFEEIIMHADKNGKLAYLSKGSAVIPHDISNNLMKLGQLDPSFILDRNRPNIGLHPEIANNNLNIDNSIAELIHIDNCSTETLPDVKNIVENAIEKHTKNLNDLLKRIRR